MLDYNFLVYISWKWCCDSGSDGVSYGYNWKKVVFFRLFLYFEGCFLILEFLCSCYK